MTEKKYMNNLIFGVWHRCDKEMPEIHRKVLCTDEFGNVIFNIWDGKQWVHEYAKMVAWTTIPAYLSVEITEGENNE